MKTITIALVCSLMALTAPNVQANPTFPCIEPEDDPEPMPLVIVKIDSGGHGRRGVSIWAYGNPEEDTGRFTFYGACGVIPIEDVIQCLETLGEACAISLDDVILCSDPLDEACAITIEEIIRCIKTLGEHCPDLDP